MIFGGPVGKSRVPASPAFIAMAQSWMKDPSKELIGLVWSAYQNMCDSPPTVDQRDLERSITQLLEPRIRREMSGYEPYYVQHGPFERETMKAPPAQPPEYDIAFVLRADERIMWPIEAKVLEKPGRVATYVADVKNEFLTCRYAPFSGSGAMLGYLLDGDPNTALDEISRSLGCQIHDLSEHPDKPNGVSTHTRSVPAGKLYPSTFSMFHLVLSFHGLSRSQELVGAAVEQ